MTSTVTGRDVAPARWSSWRPCAPGRRLLLRALAAAGSAFGGGRGSLGPFDTPFQPGRRDEAHSCTARSRRSRRRPAWPRSRPCAAGAPYLMAGARPPRWPPRYIYATGDEVLPLGGYAGTTPAPPVTPPARCRAMAEGPLPPGACSASTGGDGVRRASWRRSASRSVHAGQRGRRRLAPKVTGVLLPRLRAWRRPDRVSGVGGPGGVRRGGGRRRPAGNSPRRRRRGRARRPARSGRTPHRRPTRRRS